MDSQLHALTALPRESQVLTGQDMFGL